MSAPMLSAELLEMLDERLRRLAPEQAQLLRGGLSHDEMSRVMSSVDVQLPVEARRWWAWRDGIARESVESHVDRELGPNEVFLPLEEAVSLMLARRELARSVEPGAGLPEGATWGASWLPVARTPTGVIVCDCAVAEGAGSPILLIDPRLEEDVWVPRAATFGQWVSWWIEAIDSGAWVYSDDERRWKRLWLRLSPELEASLLV